MSPSPNNKLKLLADENVPSKAIERLLQEGFNIKRVPRGESDQKVGELAKSEQRVILSFDKDFANTLLFPPQEYFGIVFIRIRPPLIKTVVSSLLGLFDSVPVSEFKGRLFSLSASGFRVFPKRPPRIKGQ